MGWLATKIRYRILGEVNDLPPHYLGAPPSDTFYNNPEPEDYTALRKPFDRAFAKFLKKARTS